MKGSGVFFNYGGHRLRARSRPISRDEKRLPTPFCMAWLLVALCSGAAGAQDFAFPADSVGQMLKQRLTPPSQVSIPLLPATSQSQPQSLRAPDRLPVTLWHLPYAEFPRAPNVLADEQQRIAWHHAALDIPSLAAEVDPARPLIPQMPVSARAFVVSSEPNSVPSVPRPDRANESRPQVKDDPTATAAHRVIVAPLTPAQPVPPPLLRLSIPDPFAYLRPVQLRDAPPDNDPPAASLVRPARPTLSAVPLAE
jgi:hypothetical protein